MRTMRIVVTINGQEVCLDASPTERLTTLLRHHLGLKGTKVGCDAGDCGACSVLLDGEVVCACMVAAAQVDRRLITTVEGLEDDPIGRRLQRAFLDYGAAQCGICTPGMLTTALAFLRSSDRPSEDAVEEALGGVLCRCTGYRSILSAVMEVAHHDPRSGARDVPQFPDVRPSVGRAIPRLDGGPKVRGLDCFGADAIPGDALYLKIIRSPYAHARFMFGDIDGLVDAHPGLERVLTAADIPGINRHGVIPGFIDQPIFAENLVRFRGEAIAALVGERDAIDAFDTMDFPVVWDELKPILSIDEAVDAGAPQLHDDRRGNILASGRVTRGAIRDGFAEADVRLEREVQTAVIEHAYIEPEAGWAQRIGDRIEIACCTQAPHMNLDAVAAMLGIDREAVRILPTAVGGGFGSKLDLTTQPYVALAAYLCGRPAALVFSRPESMQVSTKRHPAMIKVRAGVRRDGRITAFSFDGSFDTGAYASWGPTVANRVPVHAGGPYQLQNYSADARAILTNGPIGGAFRGFGVPQAAIAQETLYDQLADAVGLDRLDFRLRNALQNGKPTVTGQVFEDGVGIVPCLEALRPYWEKARGRVATQDAKVTRRRGVGIACCWYGCGNTSLPNPSTMKLGLHRHGHVVLFQGAVDIGQGSNTVITQMAADALGLPLSAFHLESADTDTTPDAGKTSASRQTFVSGMAAMRAGASLRRELLRHANASDQAMLALKGDVIEVVEDDLVRRIALQEMPADKEGLVAVVAETFDPPTAPLNDDGQGEPYAVYGYGAHLVELEVDIELGTIRLIKVIAAHDVGRAINPTLVRGQVEGGIAQGIGLALMEDYRYARSENLHDYLIPTTGDVPAIETIIIEEAASAGPYGAKGLGEHALIPTAPAILNAIRDATGASIDKLPATPDRVLAAIQSQTGRTSLGQGYEHG
ncbi:MAG: molybdopterin-dependent oxidoreductase [Pseudomonadota bacterium]